MADILLPVAGSSSRYPGVKPKWLLTHPLGDMMIMKAISGFDLENADRIIVTMLKEHVYKFNAKIGIKNAFRKAGLSKKLKILVLDDQTEDQPSTIAKTIKHFNINGPIYIKDSDNYFECDVLYENGVSVFDIESLDSVNAGNKSYVNVKNGLITNIIEKRVISPLFCCGGYGFKSGKEFLKYYEESKKNCPDSGLYVSHVICKMMLDGEEFKANKVENYVDWGTLKDWERYCNEFGAIFIDLDGTLIKNSGRYIPPYWGETKSIQNNVDLINSLYNSGKMKIVITTARSNDFKSTTIDQLSRLGVNYHDIIFELPHAKRYLINDFARSNPYPSAIAININRNGDISEYLPALNNQQPKIIKPKINKSHKRIAVCLSGLARTYKDTVSNFKSCITPDGNDYDVFINTWNTNDSTSSTEYSVRNRGVSGGFINHQDIVYNYNPRSIEIEKMFEWDDFEKYDRKRSDTFVPSVLSMFYKILAADKMRRKVEDSVGFKYDMVVRARFDTKMTNVLDYDLGDNDILIPKMWSSKCVQFDKKWVNDTFAVGTSEAMAIYSNLFDSIDLLYDHGFPFQPEIMLYGWLKRYDLKIGIIDSYPQILRLNGDLSKVPE